MPIYVYKNLDTGETFEIHQSIKDDALKEDPKTGAPVRRMIQPVGIAFKGSGFYVNDSQNTKSTSTPPGTAANTGSDKAGSDKAASKSESSSESSAAKSETKSTSSSSSESKSSSSTTSSTSSTKK